MDAGPPGAGWGASGPAARGRPAPWGAAPTPDGPRRGRRRFLALVLLGVTLAAGTLTVVRLGTWFREPDRPTLLLLGAAHETDLALPADPAGWHSLERLADWALANGWPTSLRRLTVAEPWDAGLDESARCQIVVLTAPGGADPQGAFLLTERGDGATPPEPLRLRAILERLARLPRDQVKLLVVDATRSESIPELGVVRNDFARALLAAEADVAAVPNLAVVCASGPDERSWAGPEVGEPYFGRALRRALAVGGAGADEQFSLARAVRAACGEAAELARLNRLASQRPVILPGGGGGERRLSAVRLARAADAGDEAPPAELPAEWGDVWARVSAWRGRSPAPAAVAPEVWRDYQAAAARWEQLALAGSPAAPRMRERLHALDAELERACRLDLTASAASLALAQWTKAGPRSPEADQLADQLAPLSDADAAKLWDDQLTARGGKPAELSALRFGVLARLAELFAGRSLLTVDRFSALAERVRDPARVPPVELFRLQLLAANAPRGADAPPLELLRRAASVRLLAERAVLGLPPDGADPAHEWARPFAAPLLAAPDADRRLGEDLVIVAPPWADASAAFDRAEAGYGRASAASQVARQVAQVARQVADELPALGDWIASRPADIDDVLQLWSAWHDLGRDFARAAVAPDPSAALPPLADRARAMGDTLARFLKQYRVRMAELAGAELPSLWREAEAGLAVPTLDAEVRRRLIQNARRTSAALWESSQRGGAGTDAPPADPAASDAAAQARGRLALARLGADRATADAVGRRLDRFPAEADGWKTLTTASDLLGRAYRQLPVAANADLAAGDATALRRADALARVLPAGWRSALAGSPAGRLRGAAVRDLSAALAERSSEDHLYGLTPDEEPYYRRVGRLFLADAGDAPGAAEARRKIEASGDLRLAATPSPWDFGPVAVPDGWSVEVRQELRPAPGAAVPNGVVAWQSPGAARRGAAFTGGPVPLAFRLDGKATDESVVDPRPEVSDVRVGGWYRGQRLELSRPVAAYRRAPFDRVDRAPNGPASLAVRADPALARRAGSGVGSIAFVLDASGSMGPATPEQWGPKTKYNEAVAALGEVLAAVPAGAKVSVRAFGQSVGAGRTVRDPEEYVETVLPPTEWNPADAAAREAALARLRYPATTPWNESPVLRAMAEARDELRREPGLRTLVVLTDGQDNRFAADRRLNPKGLPFQELLGTLFGGAGIDVLVVGFQVPPKEAEAARAQFTGLRQLDPPGTYVTAEQVPEVVSAVRRALRLELRYRVETSERLPVAGTLAAGNPAGSGPGLDRWLKPGLDPGVYQVRLARQTTGERAVALAAGDRLLLGVSGAGDVFRWERRLASDDAPGLPTLSRSGWRLTLPQWQTRGRGAEGLLWLERPFDPGEATLQLPRPRQFFAEVAGAAGSAQRWEDDRDYPAAGWKVRLSGRPAKPSLRVWWSGDREPAVAARFEPGADFRRWESLAGKEATVDGDLVRFAACGVGPLRPDGTAGPTRCLTLRIEHDPANPVLVRLRGVQPETVTHRRYPEAGRTTVIVAPWAGDALAPVEIISERAAKREAAARGDFAEWGDLPPPDPAASAPARPDL